MADIQHLIDIIVEEMRERPDKGRVADYIPPLAHVSPDKFGMAVVLADGRMLCGGDAQEPFSIQSISKVFSLTLALGMAGDGLWNRVGREPSGSAFNSIVQLEREQGVPRNPFINAGAIVMSDIILGRGEPREAIGQTLRLVRDLAGDDMIAIDEHVARAELATGFRNEALAAYAKAFGNLNNEVDRVLGVYSHACAIAMSCAQLAMAGRYLMLGGRNPETGKQVLSPHRTRRINALMMTCGHYDNSGEFAFRVGLPGKSGVGGGILLIAPGVASVAVWAPGLNAQGNSLLGSIALERLAGRAGWSVFEPRG
ncbi:MAG: glutaminase [Sphingomonadales bacterium]|nr:glutaminase [Sphingomonadales bacterium]MDE2170548.1 glutaminase [Sphingomonadales bacterium]